MNLAGLISSFSTATTYTVTRTAAASVAYGRKTAGAQTSVTIVGSVSPATGDDLERLPEGRSSKEARVLFTSTLLYLGGNGGAFEADSVSIEGVAYEVSHVETWKDSRSLTSAYRCLVVRE